MISVYMVIGCPGSGKSWICDQLKNDFNYIHHDLFIGMTGPAYVRAILKASNESDKPLLIEAPFSISQIKVPLEQANLNVIPIIIKESPLVISRRYQNREKKPIPKGHLTRQNTYAARAIEWGCFTGTTDEILHHLKNIASKYNDQRI